MKPSREQVFRVIARVEQGGSLPQGGQISIFVRDAESTSGRPRTQYAVSLCGDLVTVRFTRMPFVRPYIFSRQALHVFRL